MVASLCIHLSDSRLFQSHFGDHFTVYTFTYLSATGLTCLLARQHAQNRQHSRRCYKMTRTVTGAALSRGRPVLFLLHHVHPLITAMPFLQWLMETFAKIHKKIFDKVFQRKKDTPESEEGRKESQQQAAAVEIRPGQECIAAPHKAADDEPTAQSEEPWDSTGDAALPFDDLDDLYDLFDDSPELTALPTPPAYTQKPASDEPSPYRPRLSVIYEADELVDEVATTQPKKRASGSQPARQ